MARLLQLKSSLLLLLLLSVAMIPEAAAQTGKLSGTVTDAATGSALPGVTVVLEGTTLGTVADADGQYSIIGIRPGTYTVRFTFVGYAATVVENVLITSDRTASLDASMRETVVQAGELVVVAERPVVDPNQTTSRALVTGDDIARLPVTSLEEVVGNTANSFEGFVRGSRRYETKTILEGIDISDAFYSLAQGDQYLGSTYSNANRAGETGGSILSLNPSAVAEVTVNSGASPAQYGSSSGGVIAVQLAEGRGPISGSVSARIAPSITRPGPDSLDFYVDAQAYFDARDDLAADGTNPEKLALYSWDTDKYTIGDTPEYDVRANVGGSITEDWTFGLSGQFFNTHGYLPNYYRQRINAQLKSTYALSPNTRLSVVGVLDDQGKWGGWNNRDYHEFWRFYLEGVSQSDAGAYVGSVKLTQVLSEKSFLDFQVYRTYSQSRYGYVDDDGNGFTDLGEDGDFLDFTDPSVALQYVGVQGLTRDEEVSPTMFIDIVTDDFSESPLNLPGGTRYKIGRPAPFQEFKTSIVNGARLDYANQITFNHYLQAGAELKLREFDMVAVEGQPGAGANLNDILEPFRVTDWTRNPTEVGVYVSDRIEYGGLKVNASFRVDIIDRDTDPLRNYFIPFRPDSAMVTYTDGSGSTVTDYVDRNYFDRIDGCNAFGTGSSCLDLDFLLNPSIGISHPISSRASMYFSLAHKEQLLPYSQLYLNYDGNHSTNRFVPFTDPGRDPVVSNEFELGVQWEFAHGWGIDVNAYARAIENYGTTTFDANTDATNGPSLGLSLTSFRTDFGYADARGIETVLRRSPAEIAEGVRLGLTASYTYSTVELARLVPDQLSPYNYDPANGDVVLPFDDTENLDSYPQNVRGTSTINGGYDRRHRLIVRGTLDLPYQIGVGLNSRIESGFLYEKKVNVDPRARALLTGPTNYTIDLRFEKAFDFSGNTGVDIYVDVTNLTNRLNIIAYDDNDASGGPRLFETTGTPGFTLIDEDGFSYYGPARSVYFGARLRF